jgi:hypothetical protein
MVHGQLDRQIRGSIGRPGFRTAICSRLRCYIRTGPQVLVQWNDLTLRDQGQQGGSAWGAGQAPGGNRGGQQNLAQQRGGGLWEDSGS